ncbi:MAG: SUMF1/EgtB/PvdO family nonheme iron enzyme [Pirellulales bacterium]|nr:SUMF1/EgtB/PvdO family nonheme iron enzyme [Pirellulales bacterium]
MLLLPAWLAAAAQPGGDPPSIDARQPMLRPPAESRHWDAWRGALGRWRRDARASLSYDDTLYRRADLRWVGRDFNCAFVMLWDETCWDHRKGRFTPEAFLEEGRRRFGGFDSVVFWHAYPRIGFDRRNQFDFYRDMPGGLEGLRQLSNSLHAHGVKVFLDYNPWDRGTRREPRDDLPVLADLVAAIEADGVFLDTLHAGSGEFRRLLDAARPGVALESELALGVERIHDHHLSWAQWFVKSEDRGPVGVLRNKWFERGHMQHFINRWDHDHTAELHAAWLNGAGMLIWENVFGQLRLWSARDRSILRTMVPIQRRFADVFGAEDWTPLVPTLSPGVCAGLWSRRGVRLWTLANVTDEPAEGSLLRIERRPGEECFDLVAGTRLAADDASQQITVRGPIPPRGIGAVLAAEPKMLGDDFDRFLVSQAKRAAAADWDSSTATPSEVLRPVDRTKPHAADRLPPEMVAVPATTFTMEVTFSSREVGRYESPLKRNVRLRPFAVDLAPVTNAQFGRFLGDSNYRPQKGENFLRHWQDGRPPIGKEDHPVVYVDLDDARAYAAWAGKRLPTEEEWQLAAGGRECLLYPWGNVFDAARCNGDSSGSTTPVRAFPAGRSPLGLYDMCGNTWEWTESERHDGRSRFCVLKGGSFYKAEGSHWYADGGPQPVRQAAKFLLMWPGLDRCGTIGFRCVVDLAP